MTCSVLVADADKAVRQLLKNHLHEQNFLVYEAITCKRLMEIITSNQIDLIMMDPALPDGNGLDYIAQMRAHTFAPIFFSSYQMSLEDKEHAFEKGADSFVEKPFNSRELLLRIKSHIRRYRELGVRKAENPLPIKIKFGSWTLDRSRFQIYDEQNREAPLTFQEYQLLEILAMASNKVLSRHELVRLAKAENQDVCDRSIDVKITRIRKKIGDNADAPEIIKTVRGAGYVLACPTEILEM